MLAGAGLMVNMRVPDLDEAAAFYEGKLGLSVLERRSLFEGHEDVLIKAGDAVLCIERGEGGSGNEPVTFEVENVEATVEALRAQGVEPEEYDLPSIKTVNGVASFPAGVQGAWIKDPGGNLIGLVTRVRTGSG